tara:strand:- start:55 stop:402 length:348 start_codon:yes stop_codon:yes gene_type:complete
MKWVFGILFIIFIFATGAYSQDSREIIGTYQNHSGLIETYKMKEMRIEGNQKGGYNIIFFGSRKRISFSNKEFASGEFVWEENGFPFQIKFKDNVAFVENLSKSVFRKMPASNKN